MKNEMVSIEISRQMKASRYRTPRYWIARKVNVSAAVMQQGMTRAPVVQFPSAMRAAAFKAWVDEPANAAAAKASFEATTRFGKLLSVRVTVAGVHRAKAAGR